MCILFLLPLLLLLTLTTPSSPPHSLLFTPSLPPLHPLTPYSSPPHPPTLHPPVASESYNLSWVNCEMASFIHMKASAKAYHDPSIEGLVMQSLDVLDFSVIHLSAYERSSNKHRFVKG
jgi:hypothetical protein